MAYDDEGIWNTVRASAPLGTTSYGITALNALLTPTGNETQVRIVWNGEPLDFAGVQFLVK